MGTRTRPTTLDIEVAGRVGYGMGRSTSYAAARNGALPTIRTGARRRVVPVAKLAEVLGITADDLYARLDSETVGAGGTA